MTHNYEDLHRVTEASATEVRTSMAKVMAQTPVSVEEFMLMLKGDAIILYSLFTIQLPLYKKCIESSRYSGGICLTQGHSSCTRKIKALFRSSLCNQGGLRKDKWSTEVCALGSLQIWGIKSRRKISELFCTWRSHQSYCRHRK